MKNIMLRVSIEGMPEKVLTDWNATCAILKQRHYSPSDLEQLHAELDAGLLVTTRGLTIAKAHVEEEVESFIKAPMITGVEYVGSQI